MNKPLLITAIALILGGLFLGQGHISSGVSDKKPPGPDRRPPGPDNAGEEEDSKVVKTSH